MLEGLLTSRLSDDASPLKDDADARRYVVAHRYRSSACMFVGVAEAMCKLLRQHSVLDGCANVAGTSGGEKQGGGTAQEHDRAFKGRHVESGASSRQTTGGAPLYAWGGEGRRRRARACM